MYAASSSSVVTPVTMANTAYYDPVSECIRLPPASSDAGAILEGSIIEMDAPPFPPGKLLVGEIVEIVIMDENMQPVAVHNEKHLSANDAPAKAHPALSREELIERQREQQLLHYHESQELLQKHQEEKQQMRSYQLDGRLSDDGMSQLSAEMEDTHQREVMELQERHRREQSAMMDLIFESAESASVSSKGSGNGKEGGKPQQEKQQPQSPQKVTVADRWSKAAVATVAAGAMQQSHSADAEDEKKEPPQPMQQSTERSASNLWNRAAVATVAAGTMNQSNSTPAKKEQPQQTPDSPERSAAGLWNRAAVATVAAGAMHQNAPDDPVPPPTPPSSGAATPVISNPSPTTDPELLKKQKREEISQVMKDKTLGREEKQKRLAEIKTKYAATPASQSAASAPQKPSSASRWNKAAVTAVTANTMSHVHDHPPQKPEPQQQPQAPSNPSDQPRKQVPSRWKLGAAGALAGNAFGTSYKNLKQAEGTNTPFSDFIQKVKENSPSLTTIVVDGRKDVSSDEWGRLFDALEDNCILTHLSMADCGLDDDTVVPLALALVENETLTSLNLSDNPGITSGTGKSLLKVLQQSNQVIKEVNIAGTGMSSKVSRKIQDILDDRDDVKRYEKLQAQRQMKIKALLAFSASDEASPMTQRLSQRLLEVDKESNHDPAASGHGTGHSVRSGSTGSSGGKGKAKKKNPKKIHRRSSMSSVGSSHNGGHRRPSTQGGSGSAEAKLKLRRAARTAGALKMATMGGEVLSGKSMEELRAARKLRGECEDCGQKCYTKTMFKTIPLTIPNKVDEGKCLVCAPFSAARKHSTHSR